MHFTNHCQSIKILCTFVTTSDDNDNDKLGTSPLPDWAWAQPKYFLAFLFELGSSKEEHWAVPRLLKMRLSGQAGRSKPVETGSILSVMNISSAYNDELCELKVQKN